MFAHAFLAGAHWRLRHRLAPNVRHMELSAVQRDALGPASDRRGC